MPAKGLWKPKSRPPTLRPEKGVGVGSVFDLRPLFQDLGHLDQDDKRSTPSNEGNRMPLALWGGQSAKRGRVRAPSKGGQNANEGGQNASVHERR